MRLPRLSQSPTDPGFVQNPYGFYERARAEGDLFWWEDYQKPCALGYDLVRQILKDRRFGREIPKEKQQPVPEHVQGFYALEAHSMLELEPPRHTRLRALVLRAFTSRQVNALESFIAETSARLIADFPAVDAFDFLDAFARPLPIAVICHVLGVDARHAALLLEWSNAMVAMYQSRRDRAIEEAAEQATREFSTFMRAEVSHKRKAEASDLVGRLVAINAADAEALSDEELITTLILLLNAGHEATVHMLGNGLKTLLETGTREVSDATVEELIRFDPPLHVFSRWVYEDCEILGHQFTRGQEVNAMLAAANRDPAIWQKPDRFIADRPVIANTSFGGGLHFCVGAPLARLELRIALQHILETCPNLRIAEPPRYANVYHFHGLERLMLRS